MEAIKSKIEAIASIKMMDAKGLNYLLLDQVVRTNWPGDDRPYNIREIEFDGEKDIFIRTSVGIKSKPFSMSISSMKMWFHKLRKRLSGP